MIYSHREDVTLLNPIGSLAHGWEQVGATMEHAASQVSGGEITSFEIIEKYVIPELAYVVWVERNKAKVGERQDITPFDLRVTMILRPEEGTWKVVHRHADSITTPQPIEAVFQEQKLPLTNAAIGYSPGPIGLCGRGYSEFPRRPLLGNKVNRGGVQVKVVDYCRLYEPIVLDSSEMYSLPPTTIGLSQ